MSHAVKAAFVARSTSKLPGVMARTPRYPRALAIVDRLIEQRLEDQRRRIADGTFFTPDKQKG